MGMPEQVAISCCHYRHHVDPTELCFVDGISLFCTAMFCVSVMGDIVSSGLVSVRVQRTCVSSLSVHESSPPPSSLAVEWRKRFVGATVVVVTKFAFWIGGRVCARVTISFCGFTL
ncbi:hypothetical protein ACOME3_009322 [Neoechinorhynchus agilis]